MALRISDAAANAALSALITQIGANAQIRLYTGAQPATVATAVTGTLLGTMTGAATFGTVAARSLTANAVSDDDAADASGIAGYVRILTSAGVAVLDLAVGAEVTMANVNIVAGGRLQISQIKLNYTG